MAHHHETTDETSSALVNGAMGLCLAIVVGVLAFIVSSAPKVPDVTEESFVLKPPVIDAARLAEDRQKHYGGADVKEGEKELAELLEVVTSANELQFTGAADAKSVHDSQVLTSHHANELITAIGLEAYVPAGQPMYDHCKSGFDALLKGVETGAITLEQASGDPGEAYSEYRKWCGKAFASLLQTGVVGKDGKWTDPVSGPLLFDIMNRFRWAAILDLRKPPWESLSPYEFEALTRWRVSLTSVPVEKRVQWVVSAARALPELRTEEIIGDLLLEQGDAMGAMGAYEDACKKHRNDVFLQKKCEFLRKRTTPHS